VTGGAGGAGVGGAGGGAQNIGGAGNVATGGAGGAGVGGAGGAATGGAQKCVPLACLPIAFHDTRSSGAPGLRAAMRATEPVHPSPTDV
jgi:hypothetical protein